MSDKKIMGYDNIDWVERPETEEDLLAQTKAEEQMIVDEFTARIEKGEKPNKNDMACILQDFKLVTIPQPMREYIAALLMGGIKQPRRVRRLDPEYRTKGSGLNEILHDFTRPEYDALLKKGFNRDKALELMAMATVLGLPTRSDVKEIKSKWDKIPESDQSDFEKRRDKQFYKIDRIINPRNRE